MTRQSWALLLAAGLLCLGCEFLTVEDEDPDHPDLHDDDAGDDDDGWDDDGWDDDAGDDDAGDDDSGPVGDDDSGDDDSGPVGDDDSGGPGPDFRLTGSYPYDVTADVLVTTRGCELSYELYEPHNAPPTPLIVLAHGFLESSEQMATWAAHYASWGMRVATPTQCLSLLDLDYWANAADLVELADAEAGGAVIYVGHSAGGLSGFMSASLDPHTVAYLGFDPSEMGTTLQDLTPSMNFPLYSLMAEVHLCNNFDAAIPVFENAPDGRAFRVTEAGHCDFEIPVGLPCAMACTFGETNLQFSDDEIHDTIRGTSTAFLIWQTGLDPSGYDWWYAGGHYYDALVASGAITEF